MAPEQAKDAAHVDARADIYSLGCTLYFLVTGRPPFEGRSVLEILNKHQTQPITPPDVVVKRVPRTFSAIILKMVAKKPEDRYANVGEVIDALEGFLGVSSSGPFTPREEHANLLEECARAFNASPSARLRSMAVPLVLGMCFALALLFLLTGHPVVASAFAEPGTLDGPRRLRHCRDHAEDCRCSSRFANWFSGGRLSEWLTAFAGLAILVVLLMVLKLFWIWLGLGLLAIGIAVALHAALDRRPRPSERAARTGRSDAADASPARSGRRLAAAVRLQVQRRPMGGVLRGPFRLRSQARGAATVGPWRGGERSARNSPRGATRSRPGSMRGSPRGVQASEDGQTPEDRGEKPAKPGRKPGDGPAQGAASRPGHGGDGRRDQGIDPYPRRHDHGQSVDRWMPCGKPPSSRKRSCSITSAACLPTESESASWPDSPIWSSAPRSGSWPAPRFWPAVSPGCTRTR